MYSPASLRVWVKTIGHLEKWRIFERQTDDRLWPKLRMRPVNTPLIESVG
jgi:hypothetical protein